MVEIHDLHVRFHGASREAVAGIDLTIRDGEVVGLVGESGSGKTVTAMTLSGLIERKKVALSGEVLVDGIDLREMSFQALHGMIAIVSQETYLFRGTIMENIRIGRKDATDEEVMAAAKLANCEDFIEKMPQKWDTMIGENGSELSGGERQRISIARAFLKDAPIILMDEATASLDVDNESLIQEALSKLIKDKTVLIIAHRMRTVDGADKIVVLKDGVVAENGTPDELKACDGIYRHMVELQVEAANWKM